MADAVFAARESICACCAYDGIAAQRKMTSAGAEMRSMVLSNAGILLRSGMRGLSCGGGGGGGEAGDGLCFVVERGNYVDQAGNRKHFADAPGGAKKFKCAA